MTLLHNIARTLQRRRNSTWHALGYDTTVRAETKTDFAAVAELTLTAFNNTTEAQLIACLRQQCSNCISLVAERHGQIVGHVMFSPATLDNAPGVKLMALAPMAVRKVIQNQGIGSALVRAGLELCKKHDIAAVVVLGHPAYYPRFGFSPASRFNISGPWQAPDSSFMLLELKPGALKGKSGRVQYHPAFAAL
ncbi:GNAT family N-acetyltransferase [Rheinheimera gaetbuli]